ncbi:alpha/beta-hydrolase [Acephala macrosclerotiorum]|nr:alpha/beta-hydrolase [Acephala macrosclerotiorum]
MASVRIAGNTDVDNKFLRRALSFMRDKLSAQDVPAAPATPSAEDTPAAPVTSSAQDAPAAPVIPAAQVPVPVRSKFRRIISFGKGPSPPQNLSAAPGPSAVPSAPAEEQMNLPPLPEILDSLLHKLIARESLSDEEVRVVNHLQRRCHRYAEYRNSVLVSDWKPDREDLQLAKLAANCAERVHEGPHGVENAFHSSNDYELVFEYGSKIFRPRPSPAVRNPVNETPVEETQVEETLVAMGYFKLAIMRCRQDMGKLVVSVRGTTSPIEWTAGAGGNLADASEFIAQIPGYPKLDIKAPVEFLQPAKWIADSLLDAVEKQKNQLSWPVTSVLFTGHSAGGAVAVLLCLYFQGNQSLGDIPLHCVTFGAPPIISCLNIALTAVDNHPGKILAFVNDEDLVARADRTYLKEIEKAYSNSDAAAASFDLEFGTPELYNLGKIVTLFSQKKKGDRNTMPCLTPSNMQKLSFGDLSMHDMKVYLDRIGQL